MGWIKSNRCLVARGVARGGGKQHLDKVQELNNDVDALSYIVEDGRPVKKERDAHHSRTTNSAQNLILLVFFRFIACAVY